MNIICVDEELSSLNKLKTDLQQVAPDAEVSLFLSSVDAIESAKNTVFDIAFVAIENREIAGTVLVEEFKRINPEMNIIMISACYGYLKEAIRLHASGFIKKPISAANIEKEMSNLLYE